MGDIYIYKHTSPSGKVYIGQTCQKPENRWNNGKGYKSGYFYCAIKKYGWNNIKHEVLFTGLDQLNADIIEEDLIYYYKQIGKSYNLANGGFVNKGWNQSEESKKKISEANKGKKMSDEAKEKIRLSKLGEKNPNYGKSPSEETKQKISKAMKGKGTKKVMQIDPKSGEVVKIWDSETEVCEFYNGNHSLIYDAIRRHSLTKGYYWQYEGEEILPINNRNPHCRYVEQIDKNTLEVIKVWDSLSEVERQLNISTSNISNVCKGKRKTAGGFIWRMKE